MKKKRNNQSFLSLPNEIIFNCLARISISYYPKLALVCKTFRYLIVSDELNATRFHLKTQETLVHVCLLFPNISDRPSLFTLWIKPGQILTNQLMKKSTGDTTRLVQIPSSYFSYIPMYSVTVGSEWYGLGQCDTPSSIIWVLSKDSYIWREASKMSVAREKASACALNGKLYVMGGCTSKNYTNWGEVFDPKTQTWEPLPKPRRELRSLSIRKIEANKGKLYVRSNKEDFVYDPKTRRWKVAKKKSFGKCVIDNVLYRCDEQQNCSWYDTNRKVWRPVRGLEMLRYESCRNTSFTEIANYGGKLLILWNKFVHPSYTYENKHIWCAVIGLERREGSQTQIDEVWGNIEWADKVLTVPNSNVLLRSVVHMV